MSTGETMPSDANSNYHFLEPIGAGSFGEVWRVQLCRAGLPTGIEKAVKLSYQSFEGELSQRELRVLALVRHHQSPFIVTVDEYGELDGRFYLAMELAEGTLRGRLAACRGSGTLLPRQLVTHIREAAEGLDYLHGMNIVHGGIKPDDILLVDGRAKIADFGLFHDSNTRPGHFAVPSPSTAVCMSPELRRGETSIHSDQYALACTYCWLRLGRPLRRGRRDDEASTFTEAEQAVLRRALAEQPADRFPSCVAFAQALMTAT
jgi:serine/threonine protein kinase